MADGMSGKPLWMASTRADMSESLAVAMRTEFLGNAEGHEHSAERSKTLDLRVGGMTILSL